MAIDLSQFHQVFFEESIEGLDTMEAALMALDANNVDQETINVIFRSAHSIKGGSATFGFKSVSEFTHDMETILDQVRSGRRNISPDDINIFLQSVDCMREMISLIQAGEEGDTEVASSLKETFSAMLTAGDSGKSNKNGLDEGAQRNNSEDVARPGNPHEKVRQWQLEFIPGEKILQTGNDVLRLFRELAEVATVRSVAFAGELPGFSSLDPLACYMTWRLELETSAPADDIYAIFEWVEDESEIKLAEIKPAIEVESKPDIKPVKPVASESTSIRVAIDKIDNLINLVGELVITQSMLGQLGADFDVRKLPRLNEGLGQLEHNTRELQESVMRIRMLPISFAFSRFPRMVRDLGSQLGKSINLVMLGESTELDKTVMEKIGDPLIHLVRNAIDHGIEMPETRLQAGKDKEGRLTLNAYHQGGNVVIEISDDGKGLNREALLEKAIEKNILSEDESLEMSDDQVFELIFSPGFSTAKTVSDVSGRGVGMDVVKRNIQSLNGAIDVSSEKNKGSTFTIRLPLTLAILDGQLVRVGGNIYVFPLVSIVESMQYDKHKVNKIAGGCEVFSLRDDYVPIIELREVFDVAEEKKEGDSALMVVVESGGEKTGIVVDELLAQQQVVIKSLEKNYKKVEGVSGATILGDGTVALILDMPGIVKLKSWESSQQRQPIHAVR